MSKLDSLPDRALDLASQAGDTLRNMMPTAGTWIGAGAKLGAVKAGARVGIAVVRRNPLIAVATIAGAGLLWYAAKRRAARAENGNGNTLEGSARRIEARKAEKAGKSAGTRRASGTRRAASKRSRSTASAASSEPRTEH
jgi:hypothetical protein